MAHTSTASERVIECLHPVGAFALHCCGDVGIAVHGEGGGIVASIHLNGFHVIPGPNTVDHIGVPDIIWKF